jgi:hypothetical protein
MYGRKSRRDSISSKLKKKYMIMSTSESRRKPQNLKDRRENINRSGYF